ncbi:flagellar hook-associated protein FlgK [Sphingomonas glacialis]|uniref:Flagellar hook-associated protein 1 n=1 Tax=Sphingomonas glacialis TaxID=658225 RepID=A0A502FG20_9SPHN|nr:flagellar hook-associated protein FlgK [Sphingomonas glacialis]TPG48256.1 flagellar hook-associated protein FlgK [Sphingomonas glacialis]
MSDLLGIGASGVKAYQTALTTVSENIANAATPGYAKRTADLREVAPATGISSGSRLAVGQGVLASGITRSADTLRAADVRNASADLARSDTSVEWLGRIQTALTGNQLGDQLGSFFNAAKSVAADPTASAPRSTMLEQAKTVAGSFSATGTALDSLDTDLDTTATQAATTLTTLGAALAKVNDGLGRAQSGSSGAAQLADQRDSILDQISAISDVSVTTDAAGRASVKLGDAGGPALVVGNQAASVSFSRGTDGVIAFSLQGQNGATAVTASGGALAGIAEAGTRIADARKQLDAIATAFTSGVNAVQAQGDDLSGTSGAPLFATGTSATDISVALTDPNGIAAAAKGAGSRDTANLANLATLRTTGAFESKTTALVSNNAATLASRQQVADAQGSIRDTAVAARDAVSGVNLDSEAVDLLRFQQAYSASSRVIQVARDTFQSILDIR